MGDHLVHFLAITLNPLFFVLRFLTIRLEGEENPEFFFYRDNIWHIVIVATTVGFGDIFATSMQGRAVTVITVIFLQQYPLT